MAGLRAMVNATTSGERPPRPGLQTCQGRQAERPICGSCLDLPSQVQRHSQSRKLRCDLNCWPKSPCHERSVIAQLANAIVLHPRVTNLRALRGNVGPERFTRFVLGRCQTCKTAYGTECRNNDEYPDHMPTPLPYLPYQLLAEPFRASLAPALSRRASHAEELRH
jgi:hypothetical protein